MFPLLLFTGLALIIVHGELYREREGYRVIGTRGSNPECCGSDCSLSRSACAVLCSRENSTCKSFNYKAADGSCVLNQEELYTFDTLFEDTPAWAYYGPIANEGKVFLIFSILYVLYVIPCVFTYLFLTVESRLSYAYSKFLS